MSRKIWLTHIPLSERHPSYQKVISCYAGTFLLHLVSILSYFPSCNRPLLTHVPKPFTDHSPTLPHHTVHLAAISDICLGSTKNLCSATSLPHPSAASFSHTLGCSFLCWPILFNKAMKGCYFVGRVSSLVKAVLACKAGVKGCARLGCLAHWCGGESRYAERLHSEQPLWASFL